MADHKWHAGLGVTPKSLGTLQQAVNYPKGMHSDSFDENLTLPGSGPGSRMMLVGPQSVPAGVTITLQSGSVMKII